MKQRIAVVALLASFVTGTAWSADRSLRLLASAETVELLEAESHEAAALARLLRQSDFALADLAGMAVTLNAVHGANEGERHVARLLVQYHPTTDRTGFLLRVTPAEPTAASRTMMDLEYRRVPDSADFQLVGWRQF